MAKGPAKNDAPVDKIAGPSIEELQRQITELTEKVKAGEEGALKRVCKAMDIPEEKILDSEANAPEPEEMVSYDLGPLGKEVLMVNGVVVPRRGKAARSQVEQYAMMAGNMRMRKLREHISENHVIESIAGGGFTSRVVSTTEGEV